MSEHYKPVGSLDELKRAAGDYSPGEEGIRAAKREDYMRGLERQIAKETDPEKKARLEDELRRMNTSAREGGYL